jgi:hypothetical protein
VIDRYYWETLEVAPGVQHNIPLADDVVHEVADDCICGPTVADLTKAGHTPFVWVQHRSLDSRERVEQERCEAFFDLLRSRDKPA